MYYVYILQSLKDGSFYYGSAENISQRLDQHNRGKVRLLEHFWFQLLKDSIFSSFVLFVLEQQYPNLPNP